jgi:hypothetical protein
VYTPTVILTAHPGESPQTSPALLLFWWNGIFAAASVTTSTATVGATTTATLACASGQYIWVVYTCDGASV